MSVSVIDDVSCSRVLTVEGGLDQPSTWANLVDACTRAWVRQFDGAAPVRGHSPVRSIKLALLPALAALVTLIATLVVVDAGHREIGSAELSSAKVAGAWLVSHIDDPVEVVLGVSLTPDLLASERSFLAASKGGRG